MERCIIYFLLLSLFFSCSTNKFVNTKSLNNDSIVINLDSLCNNINNSYECAKKIEKYQLTKFSHLIKRNNNKLTLKIDNNADLILNDIDKEYDDGVWYSFRDYIKEINSYIVHIQYYEGDAYYLINKNSGEKIIIPGLVKISPNKKRLVSYNMDLVAEYTVNGFVIYNLTNTSFIKEFESKIDINEWGPSNAEWINDNQIEFEKTVFKDTSETVVGKVIYEYKGKWEIKE